LKKIKKKNIVLIFTDNQQASTLGCYGNEEIHTPNLDLLSQRSFTFNNAFCPNAFCSPCRASVLTGLLPSQHGVHSWIDDRRSNEWPIGWHALDGLNTLPEILKSNGYETALIGKYHLGEPKTPMSGFDHWVTMADGHVRSFFRNEIFENGSNYFHEGHSVDFFTSKAVSFLKKNTNNEKPFFLYLPYPAPYGHWPATQEKDECRHSERYKDCAMNSVPRESLSREAIKNYDMVKSQSGKGMDYSMLLRAPNDLDTLRNYYAQISMVDDGVGEIISTLDELSLMDETLFIFTADHGLSVGHHGFWGHGAATFPSNLHKAAHSVPMIIRNGDETKIGQRSDLMVSNMDIFSTILDVTKIEQIDDSISVPSRSLLPILSDQITDWGQDAVFSEQEETRVVRTQKFVYFKRFKDSKNFNLDDELFDVENDPKEQKNLINEPHYLSVKNKLDQLLEDFFKIYSDSKADLWNGGKSLQNSTRKALWKNAWGDDWEPVYQYNSDVKKTLK
tara:strand:- start:3978 stop:5489 length:1512 start_codon:yes stop_codon:yes gene_type:complete